MRTANAVAIGALVSIPVLLIVVPPLGWAACLIVAGAVGLSGSGTRG